jgi:hypothetical protein
VADYITPIIALAGMAASALADKKKKTQEKSDNRADTAYNIRMQEAESLGAPGAQFEQEAHNANVANSRIDRTPVNYGQSLSLLGKGIGNNFVPSTANGGAGDEVLGGNGIYNAPNTVPDLYTGTLNMPQPTGNDYQLGGDLQLPAASVQPDWGKLKLDDLDE